MLLATAECELHPILFTEMLQPGNRNAGRFVRTACSFEPMQRAVDVAATVAIRCKADALLVDPASHATLAAGTPSAINVISVPDYIGSKSEIERRRYCESLPSIDRLPPGEFDKIIERSTRFSRWIRFYDKQIGKGNNLRHFQNGIERILRTWVKAAHFPQAQLRIEVFTVVDESRHQRYTPNEAYNRVTHELIEPLQKDIGVTMSLHLGVTRIPLCRTFAI